MRKIIISIILLFCSSFAMAQEGTYITFTVKSFHTNRTAGYNEENWGIGLERRFNQNWAIGIGQYENSVYEQSRYLGVIYTPLHFKYFDVGLLFGAITGYGKDPDKIGPFLVPAVTFNMSKNWGMNVAILPPVTSIDTGVVGFQLKYKW